MWFERRRTYRSCRLLIATLGALLDEFDWDSDPVQRAIDKFGHHPSIIDIKKNVSV